MTVSWKSYFDFLGYLKIFPNKSTGDVNQSCRAWIGLSSAFYRFEIRWSLGELWHFKVPAVNSRIFPMYYFRHFKPSTIRRKWLSGSQRKLAFLKCANDRHWGFGSTSPQIFLQKLVRWEIIFWRRLRWGFWSQNLKFFFFAQKRRKLIDKSF